MDSMIIVIVPMVLFFAFYIPQIAKQNKEILDTLKEIRDLLKK